MTLDALRDGLLNRYVKMSSNSICVCANPLQYLLVIYLIFVSRFCNKKGDCIWIVNRFYLAIMYRIYKKWKDKGMTIHDSCFLLKGKNLIQKYRNSDIYQCLQLNCIFACVAVEKWCRAHPQRTFSRLNEYLAQNENVVGTGKPKKTRLKKKSERLSENNAHSLSWLDLTKPSLEVFIWFFFCSDTKNEAQVGLLSRSRCLIFKFQNLCFMLYL